MAIFNSFLYVYQRVDHSAHKFLVARQAPSAHSMLITVRKNRGTSQVSTGIPDHPRSTVTRRPRVFSNVTMDTLWVNSHITMENHHF